MTGEPKIDESIDGEPCETRTSEPMIQDPVPLPNEPVDYVPELEPPKTYGPITIDTYDPALCEARLCELLT